MLLRRLTDICQEVASVVPATKGKVNPTDKGKGLVNDNNLLMMGPEVDTGLNVLRMAEHLGGKKGTGWKGRREQGGREGGSRMGGKEGAG